MSDEALMLITSPVDDAPRLARLLVERRLAACVNLLPRVSSVYRWQGNIEEAEETLLLVKSIVSMKNDIEALMREEHPYKVFELVMTPLSGGSEAYLRWMRESIG